MVSDQTREWVLLSYRIPREPSTPRIAVWRKLNDLGVAQIGDGLVALPALERTIEHLEWVAVRVTEAAGEATVTGDRAMLSEFFACFDLAHLEIAMA